MIEGVVDASSFETLSDRLCNTLLQMHFMAWALQNTQALSVVLSDTNHDDGAARNLPCNQDHLDRDDSTKSSKGFLSC